MNSYDFNDADTQRKFAVIPAGTIATVRMTVRPGSAGEGGWLRRSNDGNSEALDCEFVVLDGPFGKRKLWSLFTVAGSTQGTPRRLRFPQACCAPSWNPHAASSPSIRATPPRKVGASSHMVTSMASPSWRASASSRRKTVTRRRTGSIT